jgi:outer membrane lipoprotein-sorting protein
MPGNKLLAVLCLLFLSVSNGQAALAEAAANVPDASVSSILPDSKSGVGLLEQLIRHVSTLGDYKYDAALEALDGSTVVKATGTFYFKPASAVRMEVKDYGCKSGSILVKSSDGKIVGKGGPHMWGIKMTLGPDSRLLRMPNGLSAVQCDLSSLWQKLKNDTVAGCKIMSTLKPIKVESLDVPVIVIESQLAGESGVAVVERVFVDPFRKVPLQWDMFDKGRFQSRSKFENYQINAHWDESQFVM